LGSSESGKSTLLKSLQLVVGAGFSVDDRDFFKEIIFNNTVQNMHVVLEAMECLKISLKDINQDYHVQTIFMQPVHQTETYYKQKS